MDTIVSSLLLFYSDPLTSNLSNVIALVLFLNMIVCDGLLSLGFKFTIDLWTCFLSQVTCCNHEYHLQCILEW
jgi:hypothetical protein